MKTTSRLRTLNPHIPNNTYVHIPDEWKLADTVKCDGSEFQWQCRYSNGHETISEFELLKRGIAWFRMRVDQHTVRDFKLTNFGEDGA